MKKKKEKTRELASDPFIKKWKAGYKPQPITDLTQQQQKMLQFIYDFSYFFKHHPTMREMGAATDLSSLSTISNHVTNLEKKGKIAISGRHYTREIMVTEDGLKTARGKATQKQLIKVIKELKSLTIGEDYAEKDEIFKELADLQLAIKCGSNTEEYYAEHF